MIPEKWGQRPRRRSSDFKFGIGIPATGRHSFIGVAMIFNFFISLLQSLSGIQNSLLMSPFLQIMDPITSNVQSKIQNPKSKILPALFLTIGLPALGPVYLLQAEEQPPNPMPESSGDSHPATEAQASKQEAGDSLLSSESLPIIHQICQDYWANLVAIRLHSMKPKVAITCEHCGKVTMVPPSQTGKHFCNRACYKEHRAERFKKDKRP